METRQYRTPSSPPNETAVSSSSAAYGYTLGTAVALGYVGNSDSVIDRAYIETAKYEIEIAGKRITARPHLSPAYDPENARIRK